MKPVQRLKAANGRLIDPATVEEIEAYESLDGKVHVDPTKALESDVSTILAKAGFKPTAKMVVALMSNNEDLDNLIEVIRTHQTVNPQEPDVVPEEVPDELEIIETIVVEPVDKFGEMDLGDLADDEPPLFEDAETTKEFFGEFTDYEDMVDASLNGELTEDGKLLIVTDLTKTPDVDIKAGVQIHSGNADAKFEGCRHLLEHKFVPDGYTARCVKAGTNLGDTSQYELTVIPS